MLKKHILRHYMLLIGERKNKASTRKTLYLYGVLLSIFDSIKLVPLALMFVTYHH